MPIARWRRDRSHLHTRTISRFFHPRREASPITKCLSRSVTRSCWLLVSWCFRFTISQDDPPYSALIPCLLYTSDAADDLLCVDLGGRRIIKKKKKRNTED
eukprot:TRINITY_DN3915_c0_g1_i2.p3 TRINITY_DN3915_c0_g1~~TRINITY_DN3915_c0_g1_i2.p3  ORF type:complete len:101 (+),score=23.04 TRINITY_DN3915_c0_g1_i2:502-804(+)